MAARASLRLSTPCAARAPESGVVTRPPRRSVVIADPDASDRWLLAQPLSAHHDVYEAADGVYALALARMVIPSVVVCAADLPAIDGLALAPLIRAEPQLGHVVIVCLGPLGDPAAVTEAMVAGARRFIAKPFVPDTVVAAIRRILEGVPCAQP